MCFGENGFTTNWHRTMYVNSIVLDLEQKNISCVALSDREKVAFCKIDFHFRLYVLVSFTQTEN